MSLMTDFFVICHYSKIKEQQAMSQHGTASKQLDSSAAQRGSRMTHNEL